MIYDLIIIGAGPAGASAAIYCARKKLNFKVIAQRIGGDQLLIAGKIENYPGVKIFSSGAELSRILREQLKEYGVDVEEGILVTKIEKENNYFLVNTDKQKEFRAKTILIASGKKPRELGVPGEKEFEGKGVGYCEICDAPLFKGKTVAVIGGGNAGLDGALLLAPYAKKIFVLEYGPKITGDKLTQEKLKKTKKVEFIVGAKVLEIKGKKFVESLVFEDRINKKTVELPVNGVFIHVGTETSSDFVKNLVKTNQAGEIIIDPRTNQTSVEGIFAAGDVTDVKWKQIVVAAGEGAKAALNIIEYLEKQK